MKNCDLLSYYDYHCLIIDFFDYFDKKYGPSSSFPRSEPRVAGWLVRAGEEGEEGE